MGYSTSSPPMLVFSTVGGGKKVWLYASADAASAVDASGYFTDGYALGMRDGDQCIVIETDSKIASWHYVTVSGTTVDLADGTTIGTSTNSD